MGSDIKGTLKVAQCDMGSDSVTWAVTHNGSVKLIQGVSEADTKMGSHDARYRAKISRGKMT